MRINPTFIRSSYVLPAGLLLIAGLAGCDSSGIDTEDSVRAEPRPQASVSEASKTASHVEIEAAKLLIKTVQFSAEDGEDYTFHTSSFVVDLDLTGRANTVLVGAVPPGAWERLTFTIHKPEDDEVVSDPDFKEGSSGNQQFSVIVRGVIEGTPFVLKVRDSMRQRVAFSPPFRVRKGDGPVVVTVLADVNQWFVGRDGEALDPRRDDDVEAIADAIKASFRALGNEGEA